MVLTSIRLSIAASFCVALVFGIFQLGQQGSAFSRFEGALLDIRFALRGEQVAPSDIVILAIDNEALTQADAFPLPRDHISKGIVAAYENGAVAVILDLLLIGATENDPAMTDALAQTETTAIALSLTDDGEPPSGDMVQLMQDNGFLVVRNPIPVGPKGVLGPQFDFAAHAKLGHVDLQLDDDGALRRFPIAIRHGETGPVLPALPVVASLLKGGLGGDALSLTSGETLFVGDRQIPVSQDNTAVLNYFGPRGTFQTWSITDAATTNLEGKLVFIGATADGYRDNFVSPFDAALPGVEALATLTANILGQTTLRRDHATWILDIGLALLAGTLAACAASRSQPWVVIMGCSAIWGACLATLQGGYLIGLWLDATTVLTTLLVASLLGFAARWQTHRRHGKNLARYQSPELIDTLAHHATPVFDGRMQLAAILFVDLANFTQRSNAIGAARTADLLNHFHTLVNVASARWHGIVSFTAGDGAMVIFGLPQPKDDDAARALECAHDLLATIENDPVIGGPSHPVPVRIGVHFGEVCSVVLGDKGRATPTVTGDVVNVASRLQEQAKIEGVTIVISQEVYDAAGTPKDHTWSTVNSVRLRGRSEPQKIRTLT